MGTPHPASPTYSVHAALSRQMLPHLLCLRTSSLGLSPLGKEESSDLILGFLERKKGDSWWPTTCHEGYSPLGVRFVSYLSIMPVQGSCSVILYLGQSPPLIHTGCPTVGEKEAPALNYPNTCHKAMGSCWGKQNSMALNSFSCGSLILFLIYDFFQLLEIVLK